MGRSKSAALLLALALAASCRREEPPAAPSPELAPPARAVHSPLQPAAAGFSNDAQAELLRREAEGLGIERLGGGDRLEDRPMIGMDEGLARTREMARSIQGSRRALERGRPRSVQLPGATPGLLAAPPAGGGPEDPAAP